MLEQKMSPNTIRPAVRTFFAPVIICCLFFVAYSLRVSIKRHTVLDLSEDAKIPLLPREEYVRAASLGFTSFVADLMWFRTTYYFGEEFRSRGKFRWFDHMCRLVTNLEPGEKERFEFCGVLLAWQAKRYRESEAILTRAIEQHPDYWRFYFLRGFTRWYFLEDIRRAAEDFDKGGSLAETKPFMKVIAAELALGSEDPSKALMIAERMLSEIRDPTARRALEGQVRRLRSGEQSKIFRGKTARTGVSREEFLEDPANAP